MKNRTFGDYLYLSARGSLSGVTTSPIELCGTTLPRPLIAQNLRVAVYVAAPNNGTNYWTLELRGVKTSAAIKSVNTAAIAAATWTLLTAANAGVSVGDAETGITLVATKTGSPGALSVMPPVVYAE